MNAADPAAPRLRSREGLAVDLPTDGTFVFLPGAFIPASESELPWLNGVIAVVPDAPPVVAAWLPAAGVELWLDDRPRGRVAAWMGVGPEGGRVRVEGGRVIERLPLLGRGASPPQRPPSPRVQAGPAGDRAPLAAASPADAPGFMEGWGPGIAAACACVAVGVGLHLVFGGPS
jgi:hypothetical protein